MSGPDSTVFKAQEAGFLDLIETINNGNYGCFRGIAGSDAHFKMYERAIKGHAGVAKDYLDSCDSWAAACGEDCQKRVQEVREKLVEALEAQEKRCKERMETFMNTYRTLD